MYEMKHFRFGNAEKSESVKIEITDLFLESDHRHEAKYEYFSFFPTKIRNCDFEVFSL